MQQNQKRVNLRGQQQQENVGDVGKMKSDCRRNLGVCRRNIGKIIINLSPFDFSHLDINVIQSVLHLIECNKVPNKGRFYE